MSRMIRIGNAQGFWGDIVDAPARLLAQQPDLDYLTLDYLAEVSLSIMAIQRERDLQAGYARDFVDVVRSLVPFWQNDSKVRVVTNAGGLNPLGCAQVCAGVLRQANIKHLKIALVTGDDVLPLMQSSRKGDSSLFSNLETGEPIESILPRLVTANAYLGAEPIVEALAAGADVVITGRVADPSLTVATAMHHFGWAPRDYDRIAAATVAGHLIECGTQVTGGISTDWLNVPDPAHMGFPIIEMEQAGGFVVTKPAGTGGAVTEETVKEQLLYEIGDPDKYLSPDASVSFLSLRVQQEGADRVRVIGAKGRPPPDTYKVSATYRDGFTAQGMLTIFGRDAVAKARRCGEIILQRVREAGYELEHSNVECLGAGACVPGVLHAANERDLLETVLRISVADSRREAVERFTREIASLVTSGPQGVTGYATGRPNVRPVFGYWPCLIERSRVRPRMELIPV